LQSISVAGFPQFLARFRRTAAAATEGGCNTQSPNPSLGTRDANPTRHAPERDFALDYPKFEDWLTGKFLNSAASKKVVAVGNAIAAVFNVAEKDERNIKLSDSLSSDHCS